MAILYSLSPSALRRDVTDIRGRVIPGSDPPHALKGGGFSVHCPSQRRDSPKALSAPLNVSRRILIAVHNQPTVGADMGTHAETLVYAFPTPTAILAGIRRVDRFHSLPGACCLESKNGQEVAPSGVLNAFVQACLGAGSVMEIATVAVWYRGRTATQVGRLDRLMIDRIVLANQRQGGLVVKVRALPADVLVLLGTLLHRFHSPLAALLSAGDALLGFL